MKDVLLEEEFGLHNHVQFDHIGGRWASVGGLLPHTKKDCKGGDTKLTISYDVVQ